MDHKAREKRHRLRFTQIAVAVCLTILGIAVFMNVKTSFDLRSILEESVKSQLISISIAAREILDIDEFDSYMDAGVVDLPEYQRTLRQLRMLCESVGAEYIYALKLVDGEYVFVYDTDTENEEVFIAYELSPVHFEAFAGFAAADVMNVDDEYGSFNTGAVPIMKDGKVIGIISTDIADTYLRRSMRSAVVNSAVLVLVLSIAMTGGCIFISRITRRMHKMQQHLEQLAHYDAVTGLPNRKYLLDYLSKSSGKDKPPYALLFIDLDNFKRVNDTAGHDAGDELLRSIASFLDGAGSGAISFRPASGKLNIAARIGGDEFIQVISGISTEQEAAELGDKLIADFKATAHDRYIEKYDVGLSVGIALHPYHSDNFHVLIKYADIAMYHAKNSGKNRCVVYHDELGQKPVK